MSSFSPTFRNSYMTQAVCKRQKNQVSTTQMSAPWLHLTICLKALGSLGLEKVLSGTQRGISPSTEFARPRCILAIMAFSSF